MPFIRLDKFGSLGLVQDTVGQALNIGAFTDGLNMRFTGVEMQKMLEPTQLIAWTVEGATPQWMQFWADGLSSYVAVVATAGDGDYLYFWHDNGLGEGIWDVAGGPYSSDGNWQSFAYGDTVIFNNGVDVPQIFNASSATFEDLPNWGLISTADDILNNREPSKLVQASCTSLQPYKTFLVASGVTESGLYQPNKVWWSDSSNEVGYYGAPNWDYETPASLSGQIEIDPESGAIRTSAQLNENLIIYTDTSATAMTFVGGSFVMSFRRLFNKGAAGLHCVAEFNNQHFAVSQDQIYIHDGSTVNLIAKDRIEEEFFIRVGKGGRFGGGEVDWEDCQVVKNPDRKEILINFGEKTAASCIPVQIVVQPVDQVPTVVCLEYECDALDNYLLSLGPDSYYALTNGLADIEGGVVEYRAVVPDLMPAGNDLLIESSGQNTVNPLYPSTMDNCSGTAFGGVSEGASMICGLAGQPVPILNNQSGAGSLLLIGDGISTFFVRWANNAVRAGFNWGIDGLLVNFQGFNDHTFYATEFSRKTSEPEGGSFMALLVWEGYANPASAFNWSSTLKVYDHTGLIVDTVIDDLVGKNDTPFHDISGICSQIEINPENNTSGAQNCFFKQAAITDAEALALVESYNQNFAGYQDLRPECTPCKVYECDAVDTYIRSLAPVSYYAMDNSGVGEPLNNVLYDEGTAALDITQAGGNALVKDYPAGLFDGENCTGTGFYGVGAIFDYSPFTTGSPDYNTATCEGTFICMWRTAVEGQSGSGGRYEIQWGEAVQFVSVKGLVSGQCNIVLTAKHSSTPPVNDDRTLTGIPSIGANPSTATSGVIVTWNRVGATNTIELRAYGLDGTLLDTVEYAGTINDGSYSCYRSTINFDRSVQSYFTWRDTAITAEEIAGFTDAIAQNQADYQDPRPECQ